MSHPGPYEAYYLAATPVEYVFSSREKSGINTLFISGLPDDVKAREIHNLFRRRPGFETCQLKYTGRGNQVVAFATFANHHSAMVALHSLNGVKFDPQTGSTLHIELARSNSRRKRELDSGSYVVIDKRVKADAEARIASSEDGDSDPEDTCTENRDDYVTVNSELPNNDNDAAALATDSAEKTNIGACSTLFIANLGPNCTEEELEHVLSRYQGFNSLKLRASGGMPVCFADYERVEQATEAMNGLRGVSLASSDRGGMHVEYARSKMRKR